MMVGAAFFVDTPSSNAVLAVLRVAALVRALCRWHLPGIGVRDRLVAVRALPSLIARAYGLVARSPSAHDVRRCWRTASASRDGAAHRALVAAFGALRRGGAPPPCAVEVAALDPRSLDARTPRGHTLLTLAAAAGAGGCVRDLVARGARVAPDRPPRGASRGRASAPCSLGAAHVALAHRRYDIVDFLLANGAPHTTLDVDVYARRRALDATAFAVASCRALAAAARAAPAPRRRSAPRLEAALAVAGRLPDGPFSTVLRFLAGGGDAALRAAAAAERRGLERSDALYAPTRYAYQRLAPPL